MLLLHPASQNTQSLGTATPTFRKQGSTSIINCSSASGEDTQAVTNEGKYKTPATVEKGKDTVQSPISRGLDTSMSGQIDVGHCHEY